MSDPIKTYLLIRIPPQAYPVYLVVEHDAYHCKPEDVGTPERDESNQFYFEESTCPTNFIPVEEFYYNGCDDPHEIFEYCGEVLQTENMPLDCNGAVDFAEIWPILKEKK